MMGSIIINILVAILALGISCPMVAIMKRLSKEEKVFAKGFKEEIAFSPWVAIATSFLWIALLYVYGFSELFVLYAFISVILIIDVYTDIKAQIIPNSLNMILFIVGLIYLYIKLVFDIHCGIDLLLGFFVGGGIFALIALFALLLYRKEGMGLGDVKLMGSLGLLLGARNIFQIFVLSFAVGAIISIFLLLTKRKKMDDYIPFGPFIVIATMITMFVPYTMILKLV